VQFGRALQLTLYPRPARGTLGNDKKSGKTALICGDSRTNQNLTLFSSLLDRELAPAVDNWSIAMGREGPSGRGGMETMAFLPLALPPAVFLGTRDFGDVHPATIEG
jgi:hypothetical protein